MGLWGTEFLIKKKKLVRVLTSLWSFYLYYIIIELTQNKHCYKSGKDINSEHESEEETSRSETTKGELEDILLKSSGTVRKWG